ncbi:uncharacterized protein [Ptychodera flava]|uniref:uncharacterized protein n=1 Tax=Ptychodera flava TaxID=63121 RepID=UPI00396A62C3
MKVHLFSVFCDHESTYSVKHTEDGLHFKKTKHGHVVANANASHTKEILYDRTLQIPHTISVHEHFKAPKKAPPGFDAHEGLPGDNQKHRRLESTDDFDLPDMHGTSHSTIKLVGQSESPEPVTIPSDLVEDTLKIDRVPHSQVDLSEVHEDIITNMTCMREHTSAKSPEKAKCFHHLVSLVSRLPTENVTHLAEKHIGRGGSNPHRDDELRNREIAIDVLGALATESAQTLLTEMVLLNNKPNASLIMRALLHFVELKRPPPEIFVESLESVVFDGVHSFSGIQC